MSKVLYLIALALHHEKDSISAGDGSFNFVNVAKTGESFRDIYFFKLYHFKSWF